MHCWRSWCLSRRGAVAAVLVLILVVLLLSGIPKQSATADDALMDTTTSGIPEVTPPMGLSLSPKDSALHVTLPGTPRLRYAIVMDAGSTGTRIHIYTLMCDGQGEVQRLIDEVFHEIAISLGSLASTNQIDEIEPLLMAPLLQLALQTVPDACQAQTPVCLKATAGLRLLSAEAAQVALDSIRATIRKYPFSCPSPLTAVSIISGREEGVWAWLTVNFLLFSDQGSRASSSATDSLETANPDAAPTAGIMDLGGASTQLVFEVDPGDALYLNVQRNLTCASHPDSSLCTLLSDLLVPVNFGGQKRILYQHSFLSFGLMEVRKRLNIEATAKNPSPFIVPTKGPSDIWSPVSNAQSGMALNAHSEILSETPKFSSDSPSMPISPAQWESHVRSLFQLEASCAVPPCAFGGIPLPPSIHQLDKLYAFSYFYDRLTPHFPGLQQVLLQDLISLVSQQCCSAAPPISSEASASHVNATDFTCLDLMYIKTLLLDAYGLSPNRHITLAKKINGFETCWALGAAIHILSYTSE
jgi:guanosine-diphosphatase